MTITIFEYQEFHKKFYEDMAYPHQRFGQAFCNAYELNDGILFYETNPNRAMARIMERYVKL